MVQGLQVLVELSRMDAELSSLQSEKSALPGKREALDTERSDGQARAEAAREAVTTAEQEQRRCEAEAKDQEALLTKLEGQQNQIKTNAAYTALLHEMDQARAAISDAETHILEAMETIESAREELAQVETTGRAAHGRLDEQAKAYDSREKRVDDQIASLGAERSKLAESLDPTLMARYTKIASRRSPAVSVVEGETCMGCRVGIPPQLILDMLKGESLITCGNCKRILILRERLEDAS